MNYSPFEYLLISIANAAGLDKLTFEDRIQWCKNQGKNLYTLVDEADDKALYLKGIQELQRVVSGQTDSHYMMGLDACSSGIQVLSCLTGCMTSAAECGLVYPNIRSDVYTRLATVMNEFLPADRHIGINPEAFSRQDLKEPFMTFFYGSNATPRNTFGEGTPELKAFHAATKKMCPGAVAVMEDILGCVDEERTRYEWTMPDGFEVKTKVVVPVDIKVELQELLTEGGNPSTFTHRVYREGKNPFYVAVVANVTHATDSLIIRELKRRAGTNRDKLQAVYDYLGSIGVVPDLYATEKFVSLRKIETYRDEPRAIQQKLMAIIEQVLDYPAYDVVCVHDEIKASPVHMNNVRELYKEILAEIAESDMLQDILRQLYNDSALVYIKEGDGNLLAKTIRENSQYALS